MKKYIIIVIGFLLMCAFSCENEPYEGPFDLTETIEEPTDTITIPDDFQNKFYAKLNEVEFMEQNIYTILSIDTQDNDFIAITGSENNYHSIILYLPAEITAGTYQYSPQTILAVPNLNVTYSNLDNLMTSGIGDGSITIELHDITRHYIKGTFACIVNSQSGDVHNITDGSFEVIY